MASIMVSNMTPSVLEIIKINIFFRPEEAMLETGESMSQLNTKATYK